MRRRLQAWWLDYWGAPGGRRSAAMVRIAIAVSLLWMLWRIGRNPTPPSHAYFPHGLWMLYPGRPGAGVISALAIIAWASTLAMLVGLWSRASHAVSLVTTMALAAHVVSDSRTWSHTDVVPILASFAFLAARGGDALSIDAWWRARRARALPPGASYQRSLRLVQLAIASVFALAAYEKIRAGHYTLAWALSDNLRNQLLTRFDWIGAPRTAAASWLLGASWRYELCACLNFVSQLGPMLAVLFVRRPWVRACAGALWCLEILGLGFVMSFWNLHWLPLAAAFVDWDALAAWLKLRAGGPAAAAPERSWSHAAFATCFLAFFAAQALWFNQQLNLYPFSGFPLFATVRAKRPYDRHQPYDLIGGHIAVLGVAAPAAGGIDGWIAQRGSYRWLWRERRASGVRAALATVVADTRQIWPAAGIAGARMWLSIYEAPAPPAPARLDRFDVAVIGELDREGFRSALGTWLPDGRIWIAPPVHPDLTGMQVFAIRDDEPTPIPVPVAATSTGFVIEAPITGNPVYLVGRVPGSPRPWLLAQRSHRSY